MKKQSEIIEKSQTHGNHWEVINLPNYAEMQANVATFTYTSWDGKTMYYMQITKQGQEPMTINIGAGNHEKLKTLSTK